MRNGARVGSPTVSVTTCVLLPNLVDNVRGSATESTATSAVMLNDFDGAASMALGRGRPLRSVRAARGGIGGRSGSSVGFRSEDGSCVGKKEVSPSSSPSSSSEYSDGSRELPSG